MVKILMLLKDTSPVEYPMEKDNLVIGRASDCDIVLNDISVSRRHAQISRKNDSLEIADLGSKNGIYLNGKRIEHAYIDSKDEVVIGDSILKIIADKAGKLVFAQDETSEFIASNAIVRTAKSISDNGNLGFDKFRTASTKTKNPVMVEKSTDIEVLLKRNFQLHRFIRMLNSVTDLEKLMEMCLDEIMQMVNAERGFLMLKDEKTLELVPKVVRSAEDDIAVSSTVINKVLTENVSILSSDAQRDERFDSASSIRLHKMRSIICAPLWIENDVIGVIHIDNTSQPNIFKEEDLVLVSLLSNYTAISIRKYELNIRNIELIGKLEQKVRERTNELEQSLAKISEQNEQLEKMNTLKTKLFHILNHDIRTPLSTILGFIELMESGETGPLNEKQNYYVNLIIQNAIKISDLIDIVTRFGNLISGEISLQKNKIDFKKWISEIMLPFTDNKKKIGIIIDVPERTYIHADMILSHVIHNLLENAIKFGKENGIIKISIFQKETESIIKIWDNGKGIEQQHFQKIFDHFYKIDKKEAGTGLGLSIAKYIVEIHGGSISVNSKLGEFTEFSINLPRVYSSSGVTSNSSSASGSESGSKATTGAISSS
jgi:signal transduction histidine kinase/pSer/pThr/pTyr-binding forkhead associated (FHA) protein